MGRAVWILALPALVVVSEAVESEVDQLQQTVDSDKQNVEKAVHDMEHVAAKFRYAARNDTHAIALAKNLAEEARTDAAQLHLKERSRRCMTLSSHCQPSGTSRLPILQR